jgi:hypothetical protein
LIASKGTLTNSLSSQHLITGKVTLTYSTFEENWDSTTFEDSSKLTQMRNSQSERIKDLIGVLVGLDDALCFLKRAGVHVNDRIAEKTARNGSHLKKSTRFAEKTARNGSHLKKSTRFPNLHPRKAKTGRKRADTDRDRPAIYRLYSPMSKKT